MLSDRAALRSGGHVREALRTLRETDGSGRADPGTTDDRVLLWQRRLQEFVASAPELEAERERGEAA